ncbi:MAG: Crp/Fnr family transcriptional regulator [Deltaproteobacteria bacterium]|nr:Crp/Fnr family transcriptional regulator [Deltaproteobacteria bacterium]
MDPADILSQIPIFSSLGDEDRSNLTERIDRQSFAKGSVLFRRGEPGNALYIIIRGQIRIFASTRQGNEITLALLGAGEFFGEMALLDGQPRSANAEATEDTELHFLDRDNFFSFLMHKESALRAILCALSRRLRRTDDLLTEAYFLQISHRLARKLVELHEGAATAGGAPHPLCITQMKLAGMIGATRESVNKELNVLRKKGLVQTSRNRITILDLARLKRRIR